jgi:hypothetical protein
MHPRRPAVVTAALAAILASLSTFAHDPAPERTSESLYTIVNGTFLSATAIAVAPAHSDAFVDVGLGATLQGGLDSATVRLPAGACLRDIRVTIAARGTTTLDGVDVCHGSVLRIANGRRT